MLCWLETPTITTEGLGGLTRGGNLIGEGDEGWVSFDVGRSEGRGEGEFLACYGSRSVEYCHMKYFINTNPSLLSELNNNTAW